MSIKVGDTIKVVDAKLADGRYKNGDILTVEQIMPNNGVYVKEHNRCLWESEYEVVPDIRKSDTVRLIDKFYEHEAFKRLVRYRRKDIANQSGKELKILEINCGRVRYSAKDDGWWAIPIELLEKVEEMPEKTVFDEAENLIEAFAELVKPVVEMARDAVKKMVEVYGVDFVEMGKRMEQGMSLQEAIESMNKHRYTAEQIAEAEQIIGEIVADMAWHQQIAFALIDGNIIALSWKNRYENTKKVFEAKCSPNDEYNETIGKMICLCRAVGKKLPDWIWR